MSKKTCDMEVGENYSMTQEDGKIKNMVITDKFLNDDGFLIVQSAEVIV